jgi:hypothetical protein
MADAETKFRELFEARKDKTLFLIGEPAARYGEIMAVSHREHRTVGLQFHPESAATEFGYRLIDRFLRGEASEGARLPQWSDQSTHPIETAVSVRSPWTRGACGAPYSR